MKDTIIYIVGAVGMVVLFVLWQFFVEQSGVSVLKSRRLARKLQRILEPSATQFGAKTEIERAERSYVLRVVFPDENFFVLTIGADGFNLFVPNWHKGKEKNTVGYDQLVHAAETLRVSTNARPL